MNQLFKTSFAGREINLKINYLAGQADGGVLVTYGDTVVLVTVVSAKSRREGLDFLPLTVDYQEMTFAAGKIPGGFFKREGRPNEREILTSRFIDRAIRPLFPDGYRDETQLVATVLSLDYENDPDVAAMLGASVALQIASIPFDIPIAGARVGRIDGQYVCNPTIKQMESSDVDIFMVGRKVVPGTGGSPFDVRLVMVEGGAKEIDEDAAVGAIRFGLESLRPAIEIQDEIRQAAGKVKKVVEAI
jgi:polyribonucleotide nucleotidyltransferase